MKRLQKRSITLPTTGDALPRLPPPRHTTSRQDGSPMACTSRQVLHSCRRQTLQTEPYGDPTALYPWRTGKTSAKRYPRWSLRSPCRTKDLGWERVLTRLLLAHRSSRRRANCTHLRRVSILRSADPPAGPSTLDDPHHMAIRCLGARSGWTSQEGARGLYKLACHSRQVYKVGRASTDLCDQV